MTEVWTAQQWRDYEKKQQAGRDSRYGAIPTETADGRKFDSHIEAMYYNRCLVLQQAGEIAKIECKVPFELVVNGVFVNTYELDFRITYADGTVDHVDTKSKPTLTPMYKMKKALMLALHNIRLREVFEEDIHGTPRAERRKKKERK